MGITAESSDGTDEENMLGAAVSDKGTTVGADVGLAVGTVVAPAVGSEVEAAVGAAVGVAAAVGASVGSSAGADLGHFCFIFPWSGLRGGISQYKRPVFVRMATALLPLYVVKAVFSTVPAVLKAVSY